LELSVPKGTTYIEVGLIKWEKEEEINLSFGKGVSYNLYNK